MHVYTETFTLSCMVTFQEGEGEGWEKTTDVRVLLYCKTQPNIRIILLSEELELQLCKLMLYAVPPYIHLVSTERN